MVYMPTLARTCTGRGWDMGVGTGEGIRRGHRGHPGQGGGRWVGGGAHKIGPRTQVVDGEMSDEHLLNTVVELFSLSLHASLHASHMHHCHQWRGF